MVLSDAIMRISRKEDDLLMRNALSKYQQKLELPGDAIKDAGLRGAYK